MKYNFFRQILVVGLPVAAALLVHVFFSADGLSGLYSVMSLSFLILTPYLVGVIGIYFSYGEYYKRRSYSAMFPWVPIFIFFVATLFLKIEGLACWIMILPLFLFFSSLGGLTARYFKLRKSKHTGTLHLSLAVLFPFLISPVEQLIGSIPGFYKAETYIDINAPKGKVWSHVTRVSEIQPWEDHSTLTSMLQIPRPIRAELNYEGVGAEREAIFAGGLVFNEKVTHYKDQQLMRFSINANTHDIPSTTFDNHILIGGEYFDVLEGAYELEQLDSKTVRLHLHSEFKLSTTFNFYAGLWGKWIMNDIQDNILQVVKKRSES